MFWCLWPEFSGNWSQREGREGIEQLGETNFHSSYVTKYMALFQGSVFAVGCSSCMQGPSPYMIPGRFPQTAV